MSRYGLLALKDFLRIQRKRDRRNDSFVKSIRNVFIATFVLFGLLVIGTVGYIFFEGWSPLDSLWMTVITMSTVGFGEVAPLHPAGKVLTIIGDSTQDNILHQAGIERARAIMIATGHIADNVLVTLTAREMNPDIIISARGDTLITLGTDSSLQKVNNLVRS